MRALVFSPGYEQNFFLCVSSRLKKEGFIIDAIVTPFFYDEISSKLVYDKIYPSPREAVLNKEQLDYGLIDFYEERYGDPSLWSGVYCDRHINHYYSKHYYHKEKIGHLYYLRCIQHYVKYIEKILDRAKIDYLIMTDPSGLFPYLLLSIAKRRGIKPLILTPTRIKNRYMLSYGSKLGFEKILESFRNLKSLSSHSTHIKEARAFLKNFRDNPQKPDYEKSNETFGKRKNDIFQVFKKIPAATRKIIKNPNMFFDYLPVPLEVAKKHLFWRKMNSGTFEKEIETENFVFFPLHLEPELATMLKAPMYIDQIHLIENIAKSLPITYKLYVKEHPMALYHGLSRPSGYYEKIKKIPNVRLIHPLADTPNMIKTSRLVTVITGTAGLEAALFKKPVITFARTFYDVLSPVTYSEDINKLPDLVFSKLKPQTYSDEEIMLFLSAIYENSFDFDVDYYNQIMDSPVIDSIDETKFEGLCSAIISETKQLGQRQ